MQNLDKIMKPRAIAVIGASTKAHTIGSDIMKRLQEYGFKGKIYPVNPKGGIIEGLQAYPTVLDVPGEVDLAIVVVNAKFVLSTIDQCHEKGVGGLCVISAGFKETGKDGVELEKALLEKVRAYDMRCVGPNCLGVVNTHPDIRMDGCFAESRRQKSPPTLPKPRESVFEKFPRPTTLFLFLWSAWACAESYLRSRIRGNAFSRS